MLVLAAVIPRWVASVLGGAVFTAVAALWLTSTFRHVRAHELILAGVDHAQPTGLRPAPAPPAAPTGEGTVLAAVPDVPVGGGVVLADRDVVITQPVSGTFKAFSATCTHQGCAVSEVANGTINCPCHGSRFAVADGSVTAGPATTPLPEQDRRGAGRRGRAELAGSVWDA
jgi:Rieske Fe-S protein